MTPRSGALKLKVGVARANITPPIGVPLAGVLRDDVSSGVDRDLTATALCITAGHESAILVACDLLLLSAATTSEIRQRIALRTGVSAASIFINTSHTHAVPSPPGWHEYADELSAVDLATIDSYYAFVGDQIVAAAVQAATNSRPARYGVAQGSAQIGVNRREVLADGTLVLGENPEGVTDPTVTVVRFDSVTGSPIAAMLHYACHPDVLGPKSRLISPDYVGAAREVLETVARCPVLFLQGAAGNIDPRCGIVNEPDGLPEANRLGGELACEAGKLFHRINTSRIRDMRVSWRSAVSIVTAWQFKDVSGPAVRKMTTRSLPLRLPLRPLPNRRDAEAVVAEYRKDSDELRKGRSTLSERLIKRRRLAWAQIQLDAVNRRQPPHMEFELQALQLDDLALVTCPGELFVEIGLAIARQSPLKHTLVCGYTNGLYFYIPTAAAFAQGGYEVESYRNFLQPSGPTSDWEELIIKASVELLFEMTGERSHPVRPLPASGTRVTSGGNAVRGNARRRNGSQRKSH
jgi:neutral ceramidase